MNAICQSSDNETGGFAQTKFREITVTIKVGIFAGQTVRINRVWNIVPQKGAKGAKFGSILI